MDDLFWFWIPGEPGMSVASIDVITIFFKILVNLIRFVVSMYVSAENSASSCMVDTCHRPMRLMATSSHGTLTMSQSGSKPWPWHMGFDN